VCLLVSVCRGHFRTSINSTNKLATDSVNKLWCWHDCMILLVISKVFADNSWSFKSSEDWRDKMSSLSSSLLVCDVHIHNVNIHNVCLVNQTTSTVLYLDANYTAGSTTATEVKLRLFCWLSTFNQTYFGLAYLLHHHHSRHPSLQLSSTLNSRHTFSRSPSHHRSSAHHRTTHRTSTGLPSRILYCLTVLLFLVFPLSLFACVGLYSQFWITR